MADTSLRAHLRRIASKGGRATFKKYGKKHMQKLSRKGNAAKLRNV